MRAYLAVRLGERGAAVGTAAFVPLMEDAATCSDLLMTVFISGNRRPTEEPALESLRRNHW